MLCRVVVRGFGFQPFAVAFLLDKTFFGALHYHRRAAFPEDRAHNVPHNAEQHVHCPIVVRQGLEIVGEVRVIIPVDEGAHGHEEEDAAPKVRHRAAHGEEVGLFRVHLRGLVGVRLPERFVRDLVGGELEDPGAVNARFGRHERNQGEEENVDEAAIDQDELAGRGSGRGEKEGEEMGRPQKAERGVQDFGEEGGGSSPVIQEIHNQPDQRHRQC